MSRSHRHEIEAGLDSHDSLDAAASLFSDGSDDSNWNDNDEYLELELHDGRWSEDDEDYAGWDASDLADEW